MVESFVKIKKRERMRLGVFSGVVGVSGAVLTFGILFTVFKLQQRAFAWQWYLLCSLGVGILLSGALLLCFYPSTKRLAKRLDKRYSLEEKVQTMVEYSAKEGAIVQLQREDTDRVLSTLPKPKKSFLSLLKMGAMPLLAVVMLTVSLVIPKKEAPDGSTPPPAAAEGLFEDEDALAALKALIENVKASAWNSKLSVSTWETLESGYVAALEGLLATLQEEEITEEEAKAAAQVTADLVFTLTREKNSYSTFVKAIAADSVLHSFSTVLQGGAVAYKELEPSVNLQRYSTVRGREEDIVTAVHTLVAAYQSGQQTKLTEETDEGAFAEYLEGYALAIDALLANERVSALAETEGFKKDLRLLRAEIEKVTLSSVGFTGKRMRAGGAFEAFSTGKSEVLALYGALPDFNGVENVLAEQAYSEMMKDYVLQTLRDIFGINLPRDEESTGGGEGDDEPSSGGGGGGSGKLEFPGKGEILNPTPAEGEKYFEQYGKLLGRYHTAVNDILDDESNEISEELRLFLDGYFAALW